ncbi:MAG: hypothetical protein IH616_16545 [Gemmatimonadales bacterium]|nr:hypothetical protein [Gemmatimonadales bacterium]
MLFAGALAATPITLDRPEEPGQLPALGMNDAACSETVNCCFELRSFCWADEVELINRRSSGGSPCKPDPT